MGVLAIKTYSQDVWCLDIKTWDVLTFNVWGVLTVNMWVIFASSQGSNFLTESLDSQKLWNWAYGCLDSQGVGCLDSEDVGCLDSECVGCLDSECVGCLDSELDTGGQLWSDAR
eukprot:1386790-Amorphochlora_amoeboformis.AAC.1